MIAFGKIIGGIFGFMLGARLGLISSIFCAMLGIFVGDTFDRGLRAATARASFLGMGQRARETFFHATFSVMGYIAKFDGRVSEDEIRTATNIMRRWGLDEAARRRAIDAFNEGKQAGFNWQATLQKMQENCRNHRDVLQMFVEMQLEISYVDGDLVDDKKRLLLSIAAQLGFSAWEFGRLDAMMQARTRYAAESQAWHQNNQQQHQQRQQQSRQYYRGQQRQVPPRQRGASLSDAYKLLGVEANASEKEIKRAYRKLMSQHHPDKLVSKGLPEEMMQLATEKTQQIQAAYEQVRASRKAA